ncbi:MAG: hypothetical protein QXG86_03010 [Candidatus Woesearchaeota archaeon]
MATIRTPNFFERVLLVIGALVIIVGYGVIRRVWELTGKNFGWEIVTTIFLWLILIALVILLAVSENMKEELKIVVENQLNEIKLLREEIRYKK